jgi:hypothetical protein
MASVFAADFSTGLTDGFVTAACGTGLTSPAFPQKYPAAKTADTKKASTTYFISFS